MANIQRHTRIIEEIQKRYGAVIDLRKSPGVLIEILRNYGRILAEDNGDGGTGTGGTGGGTSTVAVGITPPEQGPDDQVSNAVLLQAILKLQRDVKALSRGVAKKSKR
jgi:hypothetical protein